MAATTGKTVKSVKRPAKGLRTHVRRLKQAASKDTVVNKPIRVRPAPAK